jgi:hypothetical protein
LESLGPARRRQQHCRASRRLCTQSGPAYLAGALAFTNDWFNTNREAFNADPLSGQFGGQSFGAHAEAGYRFNMPASTLPAMTWTPYAAHQPQTFHSQAFGETDVLAGGLALNYQANDTIDTWTEIGARLATAVPLLNGMTVDFQGRAAWRMISSARPRSAWPSRACRDRALRFLACSWRVIGAGLGGRRAAHHAVAVTAREVRRRICTPGADRLGPRHPAL